MAEKERALEEEIRKPVGATRKNAGTEVESKTGLRRGAGGQFVGRTAVADAAETEPKTTAKKAAKKTAAKKTAKKATKKAAKPARKKTTAIGTASKPATKATEPGVDEQGEVAELKPLTEAGKLRLINMLLAQAEQAAKTGEFKVTTNDLIRLLQIQREMEPQRHKQVTVRWVEDEAA